MLKKKVKENISSKLVYVALGLHRVFEGLHFQLQHRQIRSVCKYRDVNVNVWSSHSGESLSEINLLKGHVAVTSMQFTHEKGPKNDVGTTFYEENSPQEISLCSVNHQDLVSKSQRLISTRHAHFNMYKIDVIATASRQVTNK